MTRIAGVRVVALAGVLMAIGATVIAQAGRPAGDPAQDPLLAEVRGLREELRQATGTSIRTQLVLARLQLQEQRILTAGRQLADVQEQLARVRQEVGDQQAMLAQMERDRAEARSDDRRQMDFMIEDIKRRLEPQLQREQGLRAQEAELLNSVNSEQAHWAELNDRLDAIERSLPTGIR